MPLAVLLFFRFIPAGAGNTVVTLVQFFEQRVYPRWRGEHRIFLEGKEHGPRFIPAGAGNTLQTDPQQHTPAVYPRWRGEHSSLVLYKSYSAGLSPLARGTHPVDAENQQEARFIPAGAGNTYEMSRQSKYATVYPRWRGEHTKRI
ncbi:hypothetical protein SEEN6803_08759 [Salmonella enterica subsp. enterica serovar Newport str. 36803]|nr:hypothetical protein SEEN6803_08759 [Salmonella enterica subsp. enterica serovar Newport str. 36803]